jgi:hypothetical protein
MNCVAPMQTVSSSVHPLGKWSGPGRRRLSRHVVSVPAGSPLPCVPLTQPTGKPARATMNPIPATTAFGRPQGEARRSGRSLSEHNPKSA